MMYCYDIHYEVDTVPLLKLYYDTPVKHRRSGLVSIVFFILHSGGGPRERPESYNTTIVPSYASPRLIVKRPKASIPSGVLGHLLAVLS